jgi:hypothetical protein
VKEGALNPVDEGFKEWTKHPYVDGTALPNAAGTGFDAWQVRSDEQDYYWWRLGPGERRRAWEEGWKLSARIKLASGYGFVGLSLGDGYRRFSIAFFEQEGKRFIGLPIQVSPEMLFHGKIEIPSGAPEYQEVELIFDPTAKEADLYLNGVRKLNGYRGFTQYLKENRGVVFGAIRYGGNDGTVNFRGIRFQTN